MTEIRKLYPSKSGKYVGFKALNDQVAEKLNNYYLTREYYSGLIYDWEN